METGLKVDFEIDGRSIAGRDSGEAVLRVLERASKLVVARSEATKQSRAQFTAPGLLRFARNDETIG